jgi:hypothetical protein
MWQICSISLISPEKHELTPPGRGDHDGRTAEGAAVEAREHPTPAEVSEGVLAHEEHMRDTHA